MYLEMCTSIVRSLRPKAVVYLGNDRTCITRLLELCSADGAVLHVVHPSFEADVHALKDGFGSCLMVHEEWGLNAIPKIHNADFVLLDHDYNWYIAYHSLLSIEKHMRNEGDTLPVIAVFSTGWPYGRRDAYLYPESTPIAYQHAVSTGGLIPGSGKPQDGGGMFQGRQHALYEQTPRNGVRTAIEDFLQQTTVTFQVLFIPGFGGQSILIPHSTYEKNANIAKLYDEHYIRSPLADSLDTGIASMQWHYTEQQQALEHERDVQKQQYQILQHDLALAKEAQKALERERDTQKQQCQILQHEFTFVAEEQQALERERDTQKQQCQILQHEITVLQRTYADARQEWDNDKHAIQAASRDQLKVVLSQFHALHNALLQKSEKIVRMERTRSWRWTAPLRYIEKFLRTFSLRYVLQGVLYFFFARIRILWFLLGKPCPGAARYIRHSIFGFLPKRNPVRTAKSTTQYSVSQKDGQANTIQNSEASPQTTQERSLADMPEIILRKFPTVLPGSTWGITAFFNPCGYRRIVQNYHIFRDNCKRQGLPLITVELAFGDAPFSLGAQDAEQLIQRRGGDIMFQKERLLNIALEYLPPDCDKVIWIDADALINADDWVSQTAQKLEEYIVVYPYSQAVHIPKVSSQDPAYILNCGPDPACKSYDAIVPSIGWVLVHEGKKALVDGAIGTGLVTAARRSLLDKHRFYDADITGAGDKIMVQAFCGNFDYARFHLMSDAQKIHLRRWVAGVAQDVQCSIHCLDCTAVHLWHGALSKRKYRERHFITRDTNFDPATDIVIDPASGAWKWATDKPALHHACAMYYQDRQEDG